MVNEVRTPAGLCDELIAQYEEARVAVWERLRGAAVVETAASKPPWQARRARRTLSRVASKASR